VTNDDQNAYKFADPVISPVVSPLSALRITRRMTIDDLSEVLLNDLLAGSAALIPAISSKSCPF
jgi:hypothetical protein